MRLYLDWNATAPPLDACIEAMRDCARETWANPASIHGHGRAARARVESAREAVAALAGADARDVVLTSGGTEANNIALRSLCARHATAQERGQVLILTSQLEHPSVGRVAEALANEGRAKLRLVAVRADGRIDLEDLQRACDEHDGALLLALQAVNHETGVIQPVEEAARIVRSRKGREASLHVDAVQAFGRVTVGAIDADTRSLSGHKIRGPKGIGALVTRPGLRLEPVLLGGAQEKGIRPGTTDPVAAAGLEVAARHALSGHARYAAVALLRDALERSLTSLRPRVRVNGEAPRAPHVTNVSFDGWNGPELVAALDLEGLSVSSGSACSAGTIEPSPVITAMCGEARARSAIRLSLGEGTTAEEVDETLEIFRRVLTR
jgi:cysteine desulfurase